MKCEVPQSQGTKMGTKKMTGWHSDFFWPMVGLWMLSATPSQNTLQYLPSSIVYFLVFLLHFWLPLLSPLCSLILLNWNSKCRAPQLRPEPLLQITLNLMAQIPSICRGLLSLYPQNCLSSKTHLSSCLFDILCGPEIKLTCSKWSFDPSQSSPFQVMTPST